MTRHQRFQGASRPSFLALVAFLLLAAGLFSTGPAAAHTFTRTDGNDSPSKIDLKAVSVSHTRTSVVHKVQTFDAWTPQSLQHDSFFLIGMNNDSDPAYERCAFIYYTSRLRGQLSNCRAHFFSFLPVAKLSGTTAKITIPKAEVGGAYHWYGSSFWTGANPCRNVCPDFVPNTLPDLLHDLTPPDVDVATTPLRVWEESMSPAFGFPFTVSDEHSGIGFWTIQQRPVGSTGWTDVVSGSGEGSKEPTIEGTAGTRVDYRVVALDKQGNRTVSAIRRVYVPTDAAALGDGAVFTPDPPTETLDAEAFGGSYTEIETLTYSWTPGSDCLFEIVGSGFGDWMLLVGTSQSSTVVFADQIPDLPRATVYSDESCAPRYDVFVQNDSGPFPLDAILG
jgi:hypothetical protein